MSSIGTHEVISSSDTATLSPVHTGDYIWSPKSATVAKTGDCRRFWRQIVAEIGDYSLQCGQAISNSWATCSTVLLPNKRPHMFCRISFSGKQWLNCKSGVQELVYNLGAPITRSRALL